jgi:hypothetical protein
MAAPDITAAVRFSHTLNQTVYVCPAMADYTNPTRSELNAGTRIDSVIPKDGIGGFAGTESTVTTDDLKSGVTIPLHDGEDWSGGSTITTYASKSGTQAHTGVLAKGSTVYVVLFDSTDTAGLKMDVFPCFVGAQTKARSGAATVESALTYTGVPAQNVTVPA